MRKVIGIGETILDIIFQGSKPIEAVPGGSVFNGLVSLGRAGVPVTFISELGNDRVGEIIRQFMKENQISTDFVDCFPDGKSPVSLAFLDNDHNASYLFYKDYPNQRLEVPLPPINEDDIFIFGSYYALNPVLRDPVTEFLQYAKERKAIIYYDPNFRKSHAHEAIRLRPTVMDNLEFADIVRGSNEDFFNIYGESDMDFIYKEHIQFYCDRFISTHGNEGVDLYTGRGKHHYDVPPIETVSTIGAGDNFNAGILLGLLKYDIHREDLPNLSEEQWGKIIQCGIDFSTEVCRSYNNYVSRDFASSYFQ